MDSDLRTIVTGGGTGGEGIQIWDLRNLKESFCKISWATAPSGDPINRSYNCVKFIPGKGMVVAYCTDDTPARCFNFKQDGVKVHDFNALQRSCFTLDVSRDSTQIALGDYNGNLQIDDIAYIYY